MSNPTNVDYMGWKHGVNHIMYILGICELEHDLGYVQEAITSKCLLHMHFPNLGEASRFCPRVEMDL